jgi:hypothetical protein
MKKLVILSIFCLLLTPTSGVQAESSIINNHMSNSNVNQYIIINCPDDNCINWVTELVTQEQTTASVEEVEVVDGETESASEEESDVVDESEVLDDEVDDSFDVEDETETIDDDETDDLSDLEDETDVFEDEEEEEDEVIVNEKDVRINEIMSAPETGENEWIELYNSTDQVIDLEDWILEEGVGQRTTLFGLIAPHGYLVFDKSGLNNGGDLIELKDKEGRVIDQVIYGDWPESSVDAPEKGNSLILVAENYQETETITKGTVNILQQTQEEVVVEEEAEESDEEEQVDDPATESSDEETVIEEEEVTDTQEVEVEQEVVVSYQYSEQVRINELVPNPEGSDDSEWIELYNYGIEDLDLLGWSIEDAAEKNYLINESLIVSSDGYVVLRREQTGISLNNSNETVFLKDPDGQVIDEFNYEKSKEAQSWSYFEDGWQMTEKLTQSAENELPDLQIASLIAAKSVLTDYYQPIEVLETKTLEKNTKVQVQGQVTALPGIFSKTNFYINGSQVYSSKSTFPDLAEGDVVQIRGKVSESSGEKRINISSESDILILENKELSDPLVISSTEVGEELEGLFVQIEGELIEKDGSSIYLSDEQGEVVLYLKKGAGIDGGLHKVGDRLRVKAIIAQVNEKYRLMPRSNGDIENLTWLETPIVGQLGENQQIVSSNKQFVTVSILVGFLFSLVIGLAYLFRKKVKDYLLKLKSYKLRFNVN